MLLLYQCSDEDGFQIYLFSEYPAYGTLKAALLIPKRASALYLTSLTTVCILQTLVYNCASYMDFWVVTKEFRLEVEFSIACSLVVWFVFLMADSTECNVCVIIKP